MALSSKGTTFWNTVCIKSLFTVINEIFKGNGLPIIQPNSLCYGQYNKTNEFP